MIYDAPRIIGLTGFKGSGKDEVGRILTERYGYRRVAFADALKKLAEVIGWNGDKTEQSRCDCCGMLRGRELLQVLGTEGVRDTLGTDVWLNHVRRKIGYDPTQPFGGRWVITDVRYPNEAEGLRMEGVIWRVVRNGHFGDSHASETSVDALPIDNSIYNFGNLDDLEVAVIKEWNSNYLVHQKPVRV